MGISHSVYAWPKYRVFCHFRMEKSRHFPTQFPVLLDLNIPYPINFSGHCKNCKMRTEDGGKTFKYVSCVIFLLSRGSFRLIRVEVRPLVNLNCAPVIWNVTRVNLNITQISVNDTPVSLFTVG